MTYPPSPAGQARRILGLAPGVFAAVIAALILCCCVGGPVAIFGVLNQSVGSAEVTRCDIAEKAATVEYTVMNSRPVIDNLEVTVAVLDSNGDRIADATTTVRDIGSGETLTEVMTVFYRDGADAKSCEIVSVE